MSSTEKAQQLLKIADSLAAIGDYTVARQLVKVAQEVITDDFIVPDNATGRSIEEFEPNYDRDAITLALNYDDEVFEAVELISASIGVQGMHLGQMVPEIHFNHETLDKIKKAAKHIITVTEYLSSRLVRQH